MPIYMDRHTMPEGTTPEDMAHAHHADMEKQDEHDVNFLTFWFDQKAGCVFCLADAPNEESITAVHGAAHGNIPTDIVEVDLSDVEDFLGRISDPEGDPGGLVMVDIPLRCIIFTDLKGSTDMTATMGDITAIALFAKHDEIVRDVLPKFDGREVKHTGDGFMLVFEDVAESVRCAVAIQKAFAAYNETAKHSLQVRIGINAGQPIERGNDFFGIAVNLASRTCDYAEADKILVTGIIHTLLNENPEVQKSLINPQKAYFKGFAHAVQLYEIDF